MSESNQSSHQRQPQGYFFQDSQAEMNPFEGLIIQNSQNQFFSSPLVLSLEPQPCQIDSDFQFRLSIDQSQERNTGMQQQESRMSLNTEIDPEQEQQWFDKHNLCILMVRNIRRIVKKQLKMNKYIPQIERIYLQFIVKVLKNTRKSLTECIITQQTEPLLHYKQIKELQNRKEQDIAQVIKKGKHFLRRLACSKEDEFYSQRKDQQKRQQFQRYAKIMLKEIGENRMRGKDRKVRRR